MKSRTVDDITNAVLHKFVGEDTTYACVTDMDCNGSPFMEDKAVP